MRSFLVPALAFALSSTACGGSAAAPDLSKPEGPVLALFSAAKAGDDAALKGLCDPSGGGDKDSREICALTKSAERWGSFVEFFKDGKLTDPVEVAGGEAKVPFAFGPGGSKTETFKVVQRDGKWYLKSF